MLIAILLLWGVGALGFLCLEKLPPWWRRILWLVPVVLFPALFLRGLAIALVAAPRAEFLTLHVRHYLVPAVAIASVGLLLVRPFLFDRCIQVLRTAYVVAAFGLLVIVPQMAYHAFRFRPQEPFRFERANLAAAQPDAPRIIWILMDELSYDQAFAARQPDVLLPNFDRLAKSSITFSALQPVGIDTEKIVPAILLGKPVVALRKRYDRPLLYRSSANGYWQQFDQHETVFADAQSLGWTTGVDGWYNPYCRLLPDVLDRCFWQYSEASRPDLTGGIESTNSLSQNLSEILPRRAFLETFSHRPDPDGPTKPRHMDYNGIMDQAKAIGGDARIRFVFIHLPIPHPPGIFNRRLHALSPRGTYLDNLVLADETLGMLRSILENTPSAANTTLIVSSDHSWRTFMWQATADWSEEGDRATHGGKFDPRPVLMVHLPGQNTGQTIAKPVNLLITHTILEGLLRGQIHTPADIHNLIEQLPPQSVALQSVESTEAQTGN